MHTTNYLIASLLFLMIYFPQPKQIQGIFLAQTNAILRVSPNPASVARNQNVDIAIEIVNVENLYGIDISLSFDPNIVEVVDADTNLDGIQISQGLFLDSGFTVINQADNSSGEIHFVMTQLNPSPPKSGKGNLLVIRFSGKKSNASSDLSITNAKLARPDGSIIPVELEHGKINVVEELPGPTNTSLPTQNPGTPLPTAIPPTFTKTPARTQEQPTRTPTRTPFVPTATTQTPQPTGNPTYTPSPSLTNTLSVETQSAYPEKATQAPTNQVGKSGATAAPSKAVSPSPMGTTTQTSEGEKTGIPPLITFITGGISGICIGFLIVIPLLIIYILVKRFIQPEKQDAA